jgi:hypothetical protein
MMINWLDWFICSITVVMYIEVLNDWMILVQYSSIHNHTDERIDQYTHEPSVLNYWTLNWLTYVQKHSVNVLWPFEREFEVLLAARVKITFTSSDISLYLVSKSKAIPVTSLGGLWGCEMLRIPYCLDNRLTVNCEILATCSSTYSPVRTSQEAHSVSIK